MNSTVYNSSTIHTLNLTHHIPTFTLLGWRGQPRRRGGKVITVHLNTGRKAAIRFTRTKPTHAQTATAGARTAGDARGAAEGAARAAPGLGVVGTAHIGRGGGGGHAVGGEVVHTRTVQGVRALVRERLVGFVQPVHRQERVRRVVAAPMQQKRCSAVRKNVAVHTYNRGYLQSKVHDYRCTVY